jgi:hypothetical protein
MSIRLNSLGVLLLSLVGLLFVYNLPYQLDLRFGDETTYLGSGLHFSIPFKGGSQWGPIYAGWYAFWHLFVLKAVDLYYFNFALLSVLAGIATFLFFRSLQVSFWASIWVATLFFLSGKNIPLDPKISIFPFTIFLLALFLIQRFRNDFSTFTKFVTISLAALICSYARPEFYFSFLLAALPSVFFFIKEKKYQQRRGLTLLVFFLSVILVLQGLFDNPIRNEGEGRSTIAFQQHFVTNYCIWNNIPEPMTIQKQLALFHQVLGDDVSTLTDALLKQPSYTSKHLLFNFRNTIKANCESLANVFYQTFLGGWKSAYRSVLFLLIFLPFWIFLDYRKTVSQLKNCTRNDLYEFTALLVLISPSLLAALLVFPRQHYLVFHLLLSFRIIGYVLSRLSFKWPRQVVITQFPFLSVISSLVYGAFVFVNLTTIRKPQATPTADTIRYISELRPKQHLYTLERHWYRVFLESPSTWVQVEDYTDSSFIDFVDRKNINFILMTSDMQTYFANDTSFQNFVTHCETYGFEKKNLNVEGVYLLSKKGLF